MTPVETAILGFLSGSMVVNVLWYFLTKKLIDDHHREMIDRIYRDHDERKEMIDSFYNSLRSYIALQKSELPKE